MDITREQLQARIAQLEADRDQTLARLNALIGALNVCKELLAEIDKPPKAKDIKEI